MEPAYTAGQIVVASGLPRILQEQDVVIIKHHGREQIKRISKIDNDHLYMLGDNPASSTDSRTYGWLSQENIVAKVIWPKAPKVP